MKRLLALAFALLLVPTAAAQFMDRPGIIIDPVPVPGPGVGGYAELRIQTREMDYSPLMSGWFTVGYDTVVNLTLRNGGEAPLNATFRINVTGATATPSEVALSAPGYGFTSALVAIHPDDIGLVTIEAVAIDSFDPGGAPLRAELSAPALMLPSARFVDPPPVTPVSEDDEFQHIDPFRGYRAGITAHVRIRPGESVQPRLELTNPFDVAIPGFRLIVQAPTNEGQYSQSIDVATLDARATRTIDLDEYQPVRDTFGGGYYGGPMGSYELRPMAEVTIAGTPFGASLAEFTLDRGAIQDIAPAVAAIDVQDGIAVELAVPRKPVLGAPTRVLYNVTNLDTQPAQGAILLTVTTPNNLFYEVQGPETHEIPVTLGPGETVSGSVEVTPRVTGMWMVNTVFRGGQFSYGWGGGGSFEVKGPVALGFDRMEQIFARIGEPVEVGVTIASTDTLPDAQLRVTASSNYYFDPTASGAGGDHRPGFASTLIRSRTPTSSLGTLRADGVVNTSIEIVGRSSGYYNIVPYVLAEGFAYTSTPVYDPGKPVMPFEGVPYYATMLSVQVAPRPVPSALALAPLTVALAFFVGAWTLRTKFVK